MKKPSRVHTFAGIAAFSILVAPITVDSFVVGGRNLPSSPLSSNGIAEPMASSETQVFGIFEKRRRLAPAICLAAKRRFGQGESLFARQLAEAAKQRGLSLTDVTFTSTSASDEMSSASNNDDSKPKPKYQRIEDWEDEQKELAKERAKNGTMSWEEKAQFDGQRYGDQYRQNQILNKFLR
jgi:hypothetical protein